MFDWFKRVRAPTTSNTPDVLVFKGSQEAFDYACKFLDCKLEAGQMLVGLVLRAVARPDGVQACELTISSDSGELHMQHCLTINESVPPLKVGDLVAYQIAEYDASRPPDLLSLMGFVVGKLAPEYSISRGAWKLINR